MPERVTNVSPEGCVFHFGEVSTIDQTEPCHTCGRKYVKRVDFSKLRVVMKLFHLYVYIVFGCLALAVGSSEAGANGAIPIHQACVENGCFDGDLAGFPVEINEPGRYVLTSDLTVTGDVRGVNIFAEDVVLDLNGFTIRGENTCTDTPVSSCSGPNQTYGISSNAFAEVRNGGVKGFDDGLACFESCELINVHVAHNSSRGMSVAFGNNKAGLIIRDSVFERNGGYGVRPHGDGNLIENSVFRFNLAEGIQSGGQGILRDSVVANNGSYSRFRNNMLLIGNSFEETVLLNDTDPISGGTSAGNNLCNGSIC